MAHAQPKPTTLDEAIKVRVLPAQKSALARLAAKRGLKISDLVREALRAYTAERRRAA